MRALSEVERYPKVLCSLGQFLGELLRLVQRLLVGKVQRGLLGGHSQLLQESTQVVAFTQQTLAGASTLRLPAQGVHQSLAHHDHQLAVRDEVLRRLPLLKAAHKPRDGLLESAEVKPAVLRQGGLTGVFCTHRLRGITLLIDLCDGNIDQRESEGGHILSFGHYGEEAICASHSRLNPSFCLHLIQIFFSFLISVNKPKLLFFTSDLSLLQWWIKYLEVVLKQKYKYLIQK